MTIRFEGAGGICINFPEGKNVLVHVPDLRISGGWRKVMLQSLGEGFSMDNVVYENGQSLNVHGGRVIALPIMSEQTYEPLLLGDTYSKFDEEPYTGRTEFTEPVTGVIRTIPYRGQKK